MKLNKRKPTTLEKIKAFSDFSSDGCTMSPDLTFRSCCEEHDMSYQFKLVSRASADKTLRQCIAYKGHPYLAWVYWSAVRVFGFFYYKKKDINFKTRKK